MRRQETALSYQLVTRPPRGGRGGPLRGPRLNYAPHVPGGHFYCAGEGDISIVP